MMVCCGWAFLSGLSPSILVHSFPSFPAVGFIHMLTLHFVPQQKRGKIIQEKNGHGKEITVYDLANTSISRLSIPHALVGEGSVCQAFP